MSKNGDVRDSLRQAATTDHGNCAWLEPYQWGVGSCPLCKKPCLVPAVLVAKIFLAGLLVSSAVTAAITVFVRS